MSGRLYQRWDKHQIRQHKLCAFSTFLLIITGLPLRFAHVDWVAAMVRRLGGPEPMALAHRVGAVLLIVGSIIHVLYLFGRWRQGTLRWSMMPAKRDLTDLRDTVLWLFDTRRSEPRYGRYNFIEKFEYWAVIWGTIVMVVTGFVLWFPVAFAPLVTGVGIELSKTIHGYEALLAALSIAIWHMYHAHLRADVFPMSRVWLTGQLTEEEMHHHHPDELAEILAAEAAAAEAEAEAASAASSADGPEEAGKDAPTS